MVCHSGDSMNLNKIVKLILQDAENETHPDKTACIHSVLMNVNMAVGEKGRRIREDERIRQNRRLEKI